MKISKKIIACFAVILAQMADYVVDSRLVLSQTSHNDVTMSSQETPTILGFLKRLYFSMFSLGESQRNLKAGNQSFEEQGNYLNKANQTSIYRKYRHVECTEPSQERLELQLLRVKFFHTPIIQVQYESQLDAFRATFGSPYTNSCTNFPSTDLLHKTLNKRASCPWKEMNNTESDRYPATINYVKCECKRCTIGNRFNSHSCKPIFEPQYVLRRGQCGDNNEYRYDLREEYVSVGCACSRSSTT